MRGTPSFPIRSVGLTVDGGGSPVTTGLKGYVHFPCGGTIVRWSIIADVAGACVFDVWKQPFESGVPTVTNTITSSAKPTLSGVQLVESTTLTGWIVSVASGDVFAFNVDSAATVTRVTITLWVQP